MTGVSRERLDAIYSGSSDPWGFAHSRYEQAKFAQTRKALNRPRYRSAFELGCGNGQLARWLEDRCDRYTGMDAVEAAIDAARTSVPSGMFLKGFYPCPLPDDSFDLLILSEILYFLDHAGLSSLASHIARNWCLADVLCVTWLGPTEHELQGPDSINLFVSFLDTHDFKLVTQTDDYRVDRGTPRVLP